MPSLPELLDSSASSFSFYDDGGFSMAMEGSQASLTHPQTEESEQPFKLGQNQPLKLPSSWNDLRDSLWRAKSWGRNHKDGDRGEVDHDLLVHETAALDGCVNDDPFMNSRTIEKSKQNSKESRDMTKLSTYLGALDGCVDDQDELSLGPFMESETIQISKQTSKERHMTKLSASLSALIVSRKSATSARKMTKKQASWKDLFGNSQKYGERLVDDDDHHNLPQDFEDVGETEPRFKMSEDVEKEEKADFGDTPTQIIMEDNNDFQEGRKRTKQRRSLPMRAPRQKPCNKQKSKSMGSLNRSMEPLNSRTSCSDCLAERTENATWESSTKMPQTAVVVNAALNILNSEEPSEGRTREKSQGRSLSRSLHSSSNRRSCEKLYENSISRSLRRLQAWEETGKD